MEEAILALLNQVRKVTLGISHKEKSENTGEYFFTIDSLKRHPIVVAGIIFIFALSMGWGLAHEILIKPKEAIIEQLQNELKRQENNFVESSP